MFLILPLVLLILVLQTVSVLPLSLILQQMIFVVEIPFLRRTMVTMGEALAQFYLRLSNDKEDREIRFTKPL